MTALTYQSSPLTKPVLELPKPSRMDALRAFRSIQAVMSPVRGDGVDGVWPVDTLEDARALAALGVAKGEMRDELLLQVCVSHVSHPLDRHLDGFGITKIGHQAVDQEPLIVRACPLFLRLAFVVAFR